MRDHGLPYNCTCSKEPSSMFELLPGEIFPETIGNHTSFSVNGTIDGPTFGTDMAAHLHDHGVKCSLPSSAWLRLRCSNFTTHKTGSPKHPKTDHPRFQTNEATHPPRYNSILTTSMNIAFTSQGPFMPPSGSAGRIRHGISAWRGQSCG